MNDFSTERLDPASRVPEVQTQQPGREPDRNSRRRPQRPNPQEAEPADSGTEPPHQLDNLA